VLDLWEQIRSDLQRAINAGTYPPGSRLPTIAELAARHGCSAKPVRTALDRLKADGSVVGVRGHGYYVPDGGPLAVTVADHERRITRIEGRTHLND
jgi:DNA-binding GntR family transcriptional regulator